MDLGFLDSKLGPAHADPFALGRAGMACTERLIIEVFSSEANLIVPRKPSLYFTLNFSGCAETWWHCHPNPQLLIYHEPFQEVNSGLRDGKSCLRSGIYEEL